MARTLSATLLAAQRQMGEALCKIVLSSGATTKAYGVDTTDVLLKLTRSETPYSQTAKVLIENYNNNLTSLSLEGYQGVISRGFRTGITRSAWVANTAYAIDDIIIPTTANGYQYRCAVAGTSSAIDVGSAATDRTTSLSTTGSTYIDLANTVLSNGVLTSIEIWANGSMTGMRVGSFYLVSGTTYKCRASATLGAVTAGSKQTFTVDSSGNPLALQIVVGDFIGCYFDTGSIERDGSGGSGVMALTGEYIDPDDSGSYSLLSGDAISLYATGISEPTWPTALGAVVTDGTVTWEMDGNSGDEYSAVALLKVKAQELLNSNGQLVCQFDLFGLPDQMAMDKALTSYTQLSGDTNTVKTLINLVAAAGTGLGSAYNGCTAITVDWDSEDSLINVFCPADSFRIVIGESRLAKIKELLGWTKCVMLVKADGHIHISSPTVSGVTYDYEYEDAYTATTHPFFSKVYRTRLVLPNRYIVKNADKAAEVENYYEGEATSAASYALLPKTEPKILRITSNAQGTSIAEALIQRAELDHEKGSLYAPMNVGAEVYDYVKVTDNVEGNNRIGNIGYLTETYEAGKFDFFFGFGSVQLGSSIGIGGLEAREQPYVTYAQFQDVVATLYDNIGNAVTLSDTLTTLLEQSIFYRSGYLLNSKARLFLKTPVPPYDLGDLWLDGTVIKRCTTAKNSSGSYLAADWTTVKLDEIADGTLYAKILATDILNGHILLSEATGSLDNIVNGATYGRILLTDISAGHINLYSGTVATGKWYNKVGVVLDATYGIALFGGQGINAFRTFATEADYNAGTPIQCYVGTDGKFYAGGGAIFLDASELRVTGAILNIYTGATKVGVLSGTAIGLFLTNPATGGSGIGDIVIVPYEKSYIYDLKTTLTDVTASRALDTVYQNTYSCPLEVTVVIRIGTSADTADLRVGATSSPATIVAIAQITGATGYITMTKIIPDGWYYKVVKYYGAPSIEFWTETKIGV